MKKAVIGLSGGVDSATLLGFLFESGFEEIHCCSFYYGSKHNPYEIKAAHDIMNYYAQKGFKIISHHFDLRQTFQEFKSNLLSSGGNIPEGYYNDDNMKKTVIPGRNLIFSSVMAGLAESIDAGYIVLGVHSGDHHIYPDCRPDFIRSLRYTVAKSTNNGVIVHTPFIDKDKTAILVIGYGLQPQVPYHLTRTCYKGQGLSCGKCGACQERLEAFESIGITDPIKYE